MPETIDLKELEQKAYRQSLQDGLTEILMGCVLVACGVVLADPVARKGFVGLYVIALVIFPRALKALKRRFTYPRLGTAVLRPEQPKPLIAGIFTFMLAAGVAVALGLALLGRLTTVEWYRWLPLWVGLCLAGAMVHVYSKSRSTRFALYAAVALAGGFAAGLPPLPGRMDNIAVYLIGTGSFWALIGTAVLLHFLRTHPLPAAADSTPDTRGGHDHV